MEFQEALREIEPIIKMKAHRVHGKSGIDTDELIQEGRVALWRSLDSFDPAKGALRSYMGMILDNLYRDMMTRSMSARHRPTVPCIGEDGEWTTKTVRPMSLDQAATDDGPMEVEADTPTPEQVVMRQDAEGLALAFRVALMDGVDGRDKAVLASRVDMSTGEVNTERYADIVRNLGVTKNQVDHSMLKVRRLFRQLARQNRFSGLFTSNVGVGREDSKPMTTNAPPCVGTYEHDSTVCNGDPASSDPNEQATCAFRDRCVGLMAHAHDTGENPEKLAASLPIDQLVELTDGRVATHAIHAGRITQDPPEGFPSELVQLAEPEVVADPPAEAPSEAPAASGDTPKAEPKADKKVAETGSEATGKAKAKAAKSREIPPEVTELYNHFVAKLKEAFPGRPFFDDGKTVATTSGSMYPIDRSAKSKYISWYAKTPSGRDRAVALVKLKSNLKNVDVELPVDMEAAKRLLGPSFDKVNAKPIKDGQFKVLCVGLDKEGVALCAEAIKNAAEGSDLDLPAVA